MIGLIKRLLRLQPYARCTSQRKEPEFKYRRLEDDPRVWCRCDPTAAEQREYAEYLKRLKAHYQWEEGKAALDEEARAKLRRMTSRTPDF